MLATSLFLSGAEKKPWKDLTVQVGDIKVHVKDFHMDQKEERFYWRNLGEGDVDWPEVRKALGEIGYGGYISAEIDGGDRAYLKDVVGRLDRIIAGKAPVAKM